jgi:hypothetical protein
MRNKWADFAAAQGEAPLPKGAFPTFVQTTCTVVTMIPDSAVVSTRITLTRQLDPARLERTEASCRMSEWWDSAPIYWQSRVGAAPRSHARAVQTI